MSPELIAENTAVVCIMIENFVKVLYDPVLPRHFAQPLLHLFIVTISRVIRGIIQRNPVQQHFTLEKFSRNRVRIVVIVLLHFGQAVPMQTHLHHLFFGRDKGNEANFVP